MKLVVVISILGVLIQENVGSYMELELTASCGLSSTVLVVAFDGIEVLVVRSLVGLDGVVHSESRLLAVKCLPFGIVICDEYATVEEVGRLDVMVSPVVSTSEFFRASLLGFPARDEGLYLQSNPQVRQREHIGRLLLHLTLARKQPSQEALNLVCRGSEESRFEDIERIIPTFMGKVW